MAYNVTGTAGNDSLNQTRRRRPGYDRRSRRRRQHPDGNRQRPGVRQFRQRHGRAAARQYGTIFGGTRTIPRTQFSAPVPFCSSATTAPTVSMSATPPAPRRSSAATIPPTAADFLQRGRVRTSCSATAAPTRSATAPATTRWSGASTTTRSCSTAGGGNDLMFANEGNDTVRDEPAPTRCSPATAMISILHVGAGEPALFRQRGRRHHRWRRRDRGVTVAGGQRFGRRHD